MTAGRWAQIEELFQRLMECASEERSHVLDEAAGSDPELRREVESLLSCQPGAEEHLRAAISQVVSEPSESPPITDFVGRQIGPYRIVTLIGRGGMGTVYEARDTRLRRDVALKVLPSAFSSDPGRVRRFEQEGRTAAALNHPNIVVLFDAGLQDGVYYVATELLEGETLRRRLASGVLPVRKAIDYGVQIARGLATAHAKGVIHRDVKPENLFVTKDGWSRFWTSAWRHIKPRARCPRTLRLSPWKPAPAT